MLYTEIMTQNKDFQLCYRKGKSVVSQNVILYARPNRLPVNRLGITTSKKVGNAVCRSRARRLIRQAWRENEILAPVGLDIVIVARTSITNIKSDVLSRYFRKYGMQALHQIYQGLSPQPQKGEKKS
ncbi:MAG: ribonuclease P protein component [Oscillospiraceae bacterium]|nr:ribonuclease P protein component [Oscillospiraceae bacterium]